MGNQQSVKSQTVCYNEEERLIELAAARMSLDAVKKTLVRKRAKPLPEEEWNAEYKKQRIARLEQVEAILEKDVSALSTPVPPNSLMIVQLANRACGPQEYIHWEIVPFGPVVIPEDTTIDANTSSVLAPQRKSWWLRRKQEAAASSCSSDSSQ